VVDRSSVPFNASLFACEAAGFTFSPLYDIPARVRVYNEDFEHISTADFTSLWVQGSARVDNADEKAPGWQRKRRLSLLHRAATLCSRQSGARIRTLHRDCGVFEPYHAPVFRHARHQCMIPFPLCRMVALMPWRLPMPMPMLRSLRSHLVAAIAARTTR
jgi:hypothetical protein